MAFFLLYSDCGMESWYIQSWQIWHLAGLNGLVGKLPILSNEIHCIFEGFPLLVSCINACNGGTTVERFQTSWVEATLQKQTYGGWIHLYIYIVFHHSFTLICLATMRRKRSKHILSHIYPGKKSKKTPTKSHPSQVQKSRPGSN